MIQSTIHTEQVVKLGKRAGAISQSEKERMDMVVEDISLITGYSYDQLVGRDRPSDLSNARFLVYLCLMRLGFSYSSTGRWLKRNHVTIIHGCREIEKIKDLVNLGEYELMTQRRLVALRDLGYRV